MVGLTRRVHPCYFCDRDDIAHTTRSFPPCVSSWPGARIGAISHTNSPPRFHDYPSSMKELFRLLKHAMPAAPVICFQRLVTASRKLSYDMFGCFCGLRVDCRSPSHLPQPNHFFPLLTVAKLNHPPLNNSFDVPGQNEPKTTADPGTKTLVSRRERTSSRAFCRWMMEVDDGGVNAGWQTHLSTLLFAFPASPLHVMMRASNIFTDSFALGIHLKISFQHRRLGHFEKEI